MKRPETMRTLLTVTAMLLVGLTAQAEFSETFSLSGDRLIVSNLIGEVRVESGGSEFQVRVDVKGRDADRDDIDIDTREGGTSELMVILPRSSDYVYPGMGRGSRTTLSRRGGGNGDWMRVLGEILGKDRITVRGSGRGMEVWADITVRVPSGSEIVVQNGVGKVFADGISGDVFLETRSGSVDARGIDGNLTADTGSGSVRAEDVRGDEVFIDTGSGSVQVRGIDADQFTADTGSGRVVAEDVRCRSFNVDTGSGGVRAGRIEADNAVIDTGSGSVELDLDRMGGGRFLIDTGSGGVTLNLPPDASAEIYADTGSGGIQLDVTSAVKIHHKERDELRATIGSGEAKIEIDTGSGGVRIRQ